MLSLLQGFSAPVQLEFERSPGELALLLAHDPDPFSRWDAAQQLWQHWLLAPSGELEQILLGACRQLLAALGGPAAAKGNLDPCLAWALMTNHYHHGSGGGPSLRASSSYHELILLDRDFNVIAQVMAIVRPCSTTGKTKHLYREPGSVITTLCRHP